MEETSIKLQGNFSKSLYGEILKKSFYQALEINHKLPDWIVKMPGMSGRKYRYLINSLVEGIQDARYLEIGSWAGSTACSAMWGNSADIICIDNWSEFGGPKDLFVQHTESAKNPNIRFSFIESDFRKVDWGAINHINIYLFDGPHTEIDQYDGVVVVQPALNDIYVLIVDDYNWADVRNGTNRAINLLDLKVECSIEIRTTQDNSYPTVDTGNSDWHNGYFIAVVRK